MMFRAHKENAKWFFFLTYLGNKRENEEYSVYSLSYDIDKFFLGAAVKGNIYEVKRY